MDRKEKTMNMCYYCGCMYADCNENGEPITSEYCHYNGPDGCAPCDDEYEREEQ